MKKDQLHELIQSLTKSEKRYFQLYSKRSGENETKNYLQLFQLLESMSAYDEEKLVKELDKRAINAKYLAADKNYLYRSILTSLRSFNVKVTAKQKLRKQLDFVEILTEKGLIKQANKLLKKAKNIALQEDAIEYLPELLQLERRLGMPILEQKDFERQYVEMQMALSQVRNIHEYEFYYRQINLLRVKFGKTKDLEKLKQIENLTQIDYLKEHLPENFSAKKWFLQGQAALFYIENDTKKELNANLELITLMESIPKYIKANPFAYVSIFSRVLILSKQTTPETYPEKLQELITFADTLDRDNRKVKARAYSIAYSTEMVRQIQVGQFRDGIELIPTVIELMKTYKDIIDPAFCLNNYYKFAYFSIGIDDYEKALEYLNFLLQEFSSRLRPDIYGFAKILVCICHYELGNMTLLPHLTDTAKYFLRKEKRLFEFEKRFLQLMKNSSKASDNKSYFKQLPVTLLSILESENNQVQAYFDFARWLQAKASGEKFSKLG